MKDAKSNDKIYETKDLIYKDGIVKEKENSSPANGVENDYYDNGALRKSIHYKNGNKYHEISFYKNGVTERETFFKNNKKEGIEKIYHPSGKIKVETPFTNNKINGLVIKYNEYGDIEEENIFKDSAEITKDSNTKENNLIDDIAKPVELDDFGSDSEQYYIKYMFSKILESNSDDFSQTNETSNKSNQEINIKYTKEVNNKNNDVKIENHKLNITMYTKESINEKFKYQKMLPKDKIDNNSKKNVADAEIPTKIYKSADLLLEEKFGEKILLESKNLKPANGILHIHDLFGTLTCKTFLAGGKRNGNTYIYYDDGKVKREIPFKNGRIDGIEKWYDVNGDIDGEIIWENGEMVGLKS